MSTALLGWGTGAAIVALGASYIVLVHPAPGIVCLLLALLYLPPVNVALERRLGLGIPPAAKFALAVAIAWFTLGVSDLGDMID